MENAFVLNRTSRERQENLAIATDSAERARSQASVLYEKGVVDYLALLDAQRTALASEDALIRARADVALSLVGLYRAFGGGWSFEKPASNIAMNDGIELSEFFMSQPQLSNARK